MGVTSKPHWLHKMAASQGPLEALRRQTRIILIIFLSLDIIILVSAVTNLYWLVTEQTNNEYWEQFQRSFLPVILGIFSATLLCNSLALLGLSTGKHVLLLPWLVMFLMLQILMVIGFISSLFHQPAFVGQLLLLLLLMLVMAVWKMVQCQYYTMGRPAQVLGDVESASVDKNMKDSPPKYEDVTEAPPNYEEAVMKQSGYSAEINT